MNMTVEQNLLSKFRTLTAQQVAEVEDFVEFLAAKSKKRAALDHLLADYLEAIEWVEPIDVPRVVAGEVDDDQVMAAAVAARADLIVSGDRRHLLPIGNYQSIAIVDGC